MKDLMPIITSNDGRFHDGNPATGELGTRVTAQYLNNVQDHIRDVEAELKYVLFKAGLNPNDAKTTQVYDAIIAIINANRRSASTTSKGEVQLTDSINMASSVFGASALAAKTAYDKGVEALNVANSKQSRATTLAGYGITDFVVRNIGTDENLNDIRTAGIYTQSNSTRATLDKNYPETQGGSLEVINPGGLLQRYTCLHDNHVYLRKYNGENTKSWTRWTRIDAVDKLDLYTGGTVNGDVTINLGSKLYARKISSTSNGADYLDYCSTSGHIFYNNSTASNKILTLSNGKVGVIGDLNINTNMLMFNDGMPGGDLSSAKNSKNADGIWADDENNIFHFQFDSPYKTNGGSGKAILKAEDFHTGKGNTLNNVATKAVDAYTRAEKAERTANAKQSPATTLDGYGIKDGALAKSLTTENLNAVTKVGLYGQNADVNATSGRNYPYTEAGALQVIGSAFGVMQIYTTWKKNYVFVRNQRPNGWSNWVRIDGLDRLPLTGGTLLGNLGIKSSNWSRVELFNNANKRLVMETVPDTASSIGTIMYRNASNSNEAVISIPRKNGTMALIGDIVNTVKSSVSRSNKSRTNTFPLKTGNSYSTVGSVTIYPDGRIIQIMHLKNITPVWFGLEPAADYGDRGYSINIPLWTAMPNKIIDVSSKPIRPSSNASTYYTEAGEWISAWQIYGNDTNKSSVNINISRVSGGNNEYMDLYVVVEGY